MATLDAETHVSTVPDETGRPRRGGSSTGHHGPVADDLEVTRSWTIPAAELSERFSRSSGPGGQSVNTTDSRVELSVDLAGSPTIPAYLQERLLDRLSSRLVAGVLTVNASEHRTQHANRRAARDRLAEVLREAAAPPPPTRRPTKPSRRARERRLQDKKRRGETKRGRSGRFD
jgi:ribosome-associated protein